MIKLLKVTTNKQPKTEFWMQAYFTHLNTNSFLCRKHSCRNKKQNDSREKLEKVVKFKEVSGTEFRNR